MIYHPLNFNPFSFEDRHVARVIYEFKSDQKNDSIMYSVFFHRKYFLAITKDDLETGTYVHMCKYRIFDRIEFKFIKSTYSSRFDI